MAAILQEIVTLLTTGIAGVAGGVGNGVSTLVEDIFIQTNEGVQSLSTFGGVIIVFAGVALAIGLCRWVMNFLTSLGAKK